MLLKTNLCKAQNRLKWTLLSANGMKQAAIRNQKVGLTQLKLQVGSIGRKRFKWTQAAKTG
jgi:hypothetical protein